MKLIDKTFFKFIGVGVINTIVGTAVMFLSYNVLSFSYWVSSALNYIIGGAISYFLNKRYTFQYEGGGVKTVVKFALNIAVCYFVAYGIAKPLVEHMLSGCSPKLQGNIAMVVGMGLYVMLNYLGQRFFTFRKEQLEEKEEN